MSTVDEILDEWRSAQNDANSANQERLDQILALLEGQGQSAIAEAQRASGERTAAGDQSLMDRGLFNTTILDSMRRREGEALTRETNRINEDVALNKAGVLERVYDNGPDFNALLSLLSQLGQGEGGDTGRSYNFGGINRPEGPIDPFGNSSSGGGGGYGGGGGSSGSGVTTYRNTGASHDIPAYDTLQDLQQSVQEGVNDRSESDPNLPVIPRTTWFQNPTYRIQGDFVYFTSSGRLVGRKGD